MNRRVEPGTRSLGQALVEFAVVIPLFLALLMGIVDFGRAVWATTSLASAAREAARYAIVHGGSASNTCPVGPPGPKSLRADTTPPTVVASPSCPYPSPSKQSIIDVATSMATAGGSNVSVSVCYATSTAPCSGNADTGTNARGNSVTVVITSQVNLVTPGLLGMSSFSLSGSSTMLVNH